MLLGVACDDDLLCTPVLETENGNVELLDSAMMHGACRRLREPAPLLVGTRWCPVLSCNEDEPGCVRDEESGRELDPGDVAACFDLQVEGATWDEGCLVTDAPGELQWTFTPVDCPANALGYRPSADSLALPVVEVAEVTAWLDSPGDAFARRSLLDEEEELAYAPMQLSPGAVAYVLGGEPIELAAVLTHPELGNVGWNPSEWTVRAEVDGSTREVEFDELGLVALSVAAGERMQLWLEREDATLPLGEVEGVAPEELTRMEVVSSLTDHDGFGVPFGARAVLWAGDRVVYGVPVDWTVTEGVLPLWRDATRPWGPEYIALIDEEGRRCHPAPEKKTTTYRARLRATYGELEDEITMTWTETPGQDESLGEGALDVLKGEGFQRSPLCEGPGFAVQGCGCRGGQAGGQGGLGALLLLALGWHRRRRPR